MVAFGFVQVKMCASAGSMLGSSTSGKASRWISATEKRIAAPPFGAVQSMNSLLKQIKFSSVCAPNQSTPPFEVLLIDLVTTLKENATSATALIVNKPPGPSVFESTTM